MLEFLKIAVAIALISLCISIFVLVACAGIIKGIIKRK
jgi:hypothetical protein